MAVSEYASDRGGPWFAALPDVPAGPGLAARLGPPESLTVITHPSGRPMVVGQWAADTVTVAEAGHVKVVVLGRVSITTTELARRVQRVRDVIDLAAVTSGVAGSYHLVASVHGRLRVQGTASGVRRVFYTHEKGTTVAADRGDVLARLTGAGINERYLPVWLLASIPEPLADLCPWRRVEAVPPERYLLVDVHGQTRTPRWWTPPEPELDLNEGVPAVTAALTAAVAARTRTGGTISTDLSGGLSSTSIYFLASRGPAEIVALTHKGPDHGGEDVVWARRAAAALPPAEHLVLTRDVAHMFAGLVAASGQLDEPSHGVREYRFWTGFARHLMARGSRVHLIGAGGDQVCRGLPAYLHDVLCQRPGTALNHLRGYLALTRWTLSGTALALANRRGYAGWLTRQPLTAPPLVIGRTEPELGWEITPHLPPWATPQAVYTVRDLVAELAGGAEPLAPTRGQHAALHLIRQDGRLTRHLSAMLERVGLPVEAPFFDDQVINACLAVRADQRGTPFQCKPLLKQAMRGIVPEANLSRETKDSFTADGYAGLRQNREELARLLDQSLLADQGLVDLKGLRRTCFSAVYLGLSLPALGRTLAVESWLDSHLRPPVSAPVARPDPVGTLSSAPEGVRP